MSFPRYRHVTTGAKVELLMARPQFVVFRSCDTGIHTSASADYFRRSFLPTIESCDTCDGWGVKGISSGNNPDCPDCQ